LFGDTLGGLCELSNFKGVSNQSHHSVAMFVEHTWFTPEVTFAVEKTLAVYKNHKAPNPI
jgi:hypothetical protein